MKVIIILMLVFMPIQVLADFLLKLEFKYKKLEGHYVTMYYTIDSMQELETLLKNLDTLSERKVLESFGLPLSTDNYNQENCIIPDGVKNDYKKIFKNQCQTIKVENSSIYLSVKFVNATFDLCTFPLFTKYWGSYDVNFKNAGILVSNAKKVRWKKSDKTYLNIIECKLQLLAQGA